MARIVGHVRFLTLHGVVIRIGCCVIVRSRYQDTSVTTLLSREEDSCDEVTHRRMESVANLSQPRRVHSEVR